MKHPAPDSPRRGGRPRWLAAAVVGTTLSAAVCGRAEGSPAPRLARGAAEWELVWRDEFDYADVALTNNWISQNGPSGHILSSRWRENAVVSNGVLRLIARKERRGGQEWTAGCIWTKQTFQYGYFECRYRYGAAEGLNNSFWIMPTSRRPDRPHFEIDINEGHYPHKLNTNIHNHSDRTNINGRTVHRTSHRSFVFRGIDFARDFHTFGLDWNEHELVFYLDGREIRREANAFCHSPASIWLSLAVIAWAGRITDAIDGAAMEVDYVRVYRRKP